MAPLCSSKAATPAEDLASGTRATIDSIEMGFHSLHSDVEMWSRQTRYCVQLNDCPSVSPWIRRDAKEDGRNWTTNDFN